MSWLKRGGGVGRRGSDCSPSDRKDKNLLSLCQHSSAQRDFIDQRTAMQQPLLHPSDTIYHGPSLSLHRLSVQPIIPKKTSSKKCASFWCKWLGVKCKTSDIPTTQNKWTQPPRGWGLVLQHGLTPGQRGFCLTLISPSSCHHKHIWQIRLIFISFFFTFTTYSVGKDSCCHTWAENAGFVFLVYFGQTDKTVDKVSAQHIWKKTFLSPLAPGRSKDGQPFPVHW